MKYYSEKLNRVFDTIEACERAEFEAKEVENKEKIRRERAEREAKEKKEKMIAERKIRANEVEEARKAMVAAQHKYSEVLEAFCKDYGAFHTTLTNEDVRNIIPTLFDAIRFPLI